MKHIQKHIVIYLLLITSPQLCAYQTVHELFSDIIQKDALVFDIGAHVGTKTKVYQTYGAQVVCVEPQPTCLQKLYAKFAQQRGTVFIEPYALASQPGTIALHICPQASTLTTCTQHWQHGRFNNYQWNTTIDVQATTLDNLVQKYEIPVFCKIDVEGFELEVLQGLSQKIGCISFEWTYEFVNQAQACLDYLAMLGYTKFSITYGEDSMFIFPEPQNPKTIISWIIAHQDTLSWGDIYALA